jgi:peptidoglycan/xylan/chitin deacetylase (PgdA/CDA1 family)
MSLAKNIYYSACAALPLGLIKKIAPSTTLLPYHHTVSDEQLAHIKNLYDYKNVAQFTADLDYLLKHFKPVSAEDVLHTVSHTRSLPKNAFLLTFDDGFREVYDVIAPILLSKGVPAVFFINPAYIDNRLLFYRCKVSLLIGELARNSNNDSIADAYAKMLYGTAGSVDDSIHFLKHIKKDSPLLDELAKLTGLSFDDYLRQQRPFMTQQQLVSLQRQGFSLGGHSWSHPYYDTIPVETQLSETTHSCDYIKMITPQEQVYFSFPHSDAGLPQSLLNELLQSGIDLLFGIQNQKEELGSNMLQRFNAERPGITTGKQVKGMLMLMALQKLAGKNKVERI